MALGVHGGRGNGGGGIPVAAPALSQGLGGDTDAMMGLSGLAWGRDERESKRELKGEGGEGWGVKMEIEMETETETEEKMGEEQNRSHVAGSGAAEVGDGRGWVYSGVRRGLPC